MNTSVRLAGFAVGLIAAFGLAFGAGRALGPLDRAEGPVHHEVPAAESEAESGVPARSPGPSGSTIAPGSAQQGPGEPVHEGHQP